MVNALKKQSGITLLPLAAVFCFISLVTAESRRKEAAAVPSIMLFAAASLVDVAGEICDSFTVASGVAVKMNQGSSGTLARQLEQSGGADVFISASRAWMKYVDSRGLIRKETMVKVAGNDLVMITPKGSAIKTVTIDSTLALVPLFGSGRLSIGDPEHVPAGKYAKEALDHFGWYAAIEPRLLPAKDVRSALMVVEMGESPLGIVYLTDAMASKMVNVAGTFPDASHKPIEYVAGVCRGSTNGKIFCDFLRSAKARAIWRKYGFKE